MTSLTTLIWSSSITMALPNPTTDFFDQIKKNSNANDAAVYDPASFGIDSKKSLKNNVRDMFYPSVIGKNKLRPVINTIGMIIFFIFIVVIGVNLMINADDEAKVTSAKNSFLYLMYGAFLLFGSMRLLRQLNVEFSEGWQDLVLALKDRIIFNFVSFIKAAAFFVAIIMIIYYGLQIIRSYDKDEKFAAARKGILNVVAVLVLIKVVDYVYFIAYDQWFKTKAVDLIIQVSKFLWRAIGVISVLYVIYAGFLLIVGWWESDRLKKATNIIKAIFFGVLIIFLFLLTIYQLFKDLG